MHKWIKEFLNTKFKFKYIQTCAVCLVVFILSTMLMCFSTDVWSSFFCSISAGCVTGFIFFIISGLKTYDENYYTEQNSIAIHCKKRTKDVCDNLVKIINEKYSISYSALQEMKLDLQECYIYYSGVVVPNVKPNEKQKEKAEEFKKTYDGFTQKIGIKNSLDESVELHAEVKETLFEMYKQLYIMEIDYSFIGTSAEIAIEQLKHNKF